MRTATVFGFSLTLLICLIACKNAPTADKSTPSVSAPVATQNGYFYKHLKGTIGTFPVTIDLVKIRNVYDDSPQLKGFYSYEKYQQPLPIYGSIDADGNVKLEESGQEGSSAIFTGKFDANGSFSGIWADTLKKNKLSFYLT